MATFALRSTATVVVAVVLGLVTFALARTVLPGVVPAVTVALLAGLALGAIIRPDVGAAVAVSRRALPIAIVLIGLQVAFDRVRELGLETFGLVVVALGVGLSVALATARATNVPRRLGTLLALGTAVCGNTAILTAGPIIGARRNEIAYAVATVTAFGTAAVLLLPPIGHLLGLDDVQFGIWSGLGVNDTSQVVATGYAYSDVAGETATVVKLVRNAFLGPILFGVALLSREAVAVGERRRLNPTLGIPWFVWGFVVASALVSIGAVPASVVNASEPVSKALVLVVMAAVGLSTQLDAMRASGPRPFVVGLVAMTCLSVVVLIGILAGIGTGSH